ncbi:hypothetical protein [Streptomyces qinzhouensis]|uniref:hypothetical protein n=1 Tax=Streptomyces qinzhouensis TaxID=2599401 RepID=UPI001FE9D81F|nr:hypothetical protein [Streptomyces qinzhouensis]
MSQPTALATADTVIEAAWQRPVDTLQTFLREGRTTDPTLLTVLRIRQSLVFSDAEITSQQERLHHLTRPGHVPLLHELDAVTSTAAQLRTAHAEAHARVRALCAVIDAHPENRLAEQLTRDLDRSAAVQPRAEAARARTTTPIPAALAPAVVGTQAVIPAGAPAAKPRAGRG